MNELLEIIVELLNMLESNTCTQPAKSDGHEHVLFDNIDRDRITKIRARIKAAQQGVQPTLLESGQKFAPESVNPYPCDTN